jgi:hypothetical protein
VILSGNQALDPVGLAPTLITAKQLKVTADYLNFLDFTVAEPYQTPSLALGL